MLCLLKWLNQEIQSQLIICFTLGITFDKYGGKEKSKKYIENFLNIQNYKWTMGM